MKKVLAAVLALALILCFGTACTKSGEKLVVGIDDSFPPLGFRDENNEIVGFDIDLAKAVGEKLGMEVEFQVIDWKTKENILNNGDIDLIWNGYTITDTRKEKVDFTKPYIANAQIVVVKADSALNTLADLTGKIVAAQDGSSAVDAIKANEEFYNSIKDKLNTVYAENVSAFMDLELGRIDALVVDKVVAEYYISKKDAGLFRFLEEELDPEEYGIGVAKGNTKLLNKVQKAFDDIVKDGTAAEISNEWFGEDKILK